MWSWIGVFAVVQLIIVEILLTVTWNRWYFTKGIPLMAWRTNMPSGDSSPPSPSDFEKLFHSKMFAPLLFREIQTDVYGFRQESWSFRRFQSTPIMHGKIVFDRQRRQVLVVGYANWWIVAFCSGFIGIGVASSDQVGATDILPAASLMISVLLLLYIFQRLDFVRVGKYAASAAAHRDRLGASLKI